MTEQVDHKHKALARIKASTTLTKAQPMEIYELARIELAEAQVQATLALAEQQRIANLIALGMYENADGSRPAQSAVAEPTGSYEVRIRSDIREGLGL